MSSRTEIMYNSRQQSRMPTPSKRIPILGEHFATKCDVSSSSKKPSSFSTAWEDTLSTFSTLNAEGYKEFDITPSTPTVPSNNESNRTWSSGFMQEKRPIYRSLSDSCAWDICQNTRKPVQDSRLVYSVTPSSALPTFSQVKEHGLTENKSSSLFAKAHSCPSVRSLEISPIQVIISPFELPDSTKTETDEMFVVSNIWRPNITPMNSDLDINTWENPCIKTKLSDVCSDRQRRDFSFDKQRPIASSSSGLARDGIFGRSTEESFNVPTLDDEEEHQSGLYAANRTPVSSQFRHLQEESDLLYDEIAKVRDKVDSIPLKAQLVTDDSSNDHGTETEFDSHFEPLYQRMDTPSPKCSTTSRTSRNTQTSSFIVEESRPNAGSQCSVLASPPSSYGSNTPDLQEKGWLSLKALNSVLTERFGSTSASVTPKSDRNGILRSARKLCNTTSVDILNRLPVEDIGNLNPQNRFLVENIGNAVLDFEMLHEGNFEKKLQSPGESQLTMEGIPSNVSFLTQSGLEERVPKLSNPEPIAAGELETKQRVYCKPLVASVSLQNDETEPSRVKNHPFIWVEDDSHLVSLERDNSPGSVLVTPEQLSSGTIKCDQSFSCVKSKISLNTTESTAYTQSKEDSKICPFLAPILENDISEGDSLTATEKTLFKEKPIFINDFRAFLNTRHEREREKEKEKPEKHKPKVSCIPLSSVVQTTPECDTLLPSVGETGNPHSFDGESLLELTRNDKSSGPEDRESVEWEHAENYHSFTIGKDAACIIPLLDSTGDQLPVDTEGYCDIVDHSKDNVHTKSEDFGDKSLFTQEDTSNYFAPPKTVMSTSGTMADPQSSLNAEPGFDNLPHGVSFTVNSDSISNHQLSSRTNSIANLDTLWKELEKSLKKMDILDQSHAVKIVGEMVECKNTLEPNFSTENEALPSTHKTWCTNNFTSCIPDKYPKSIPRLRKVGRQSRKYYTSITSPATTTPVNETENLKNKVPLNVGNLHTNHLPPFKSPIRGYFLSKNSSIGETYVKTFETPHLQPLNPSIKAMNGTFAIHQNVPVVTSDAFGNHIEASSNLAIPNYKMGLTMPGIDKYATV